MGNLKSIQSRAPSIHESYEHKENRDKRAKELQKLGFTVRRTRMKGQTMHPSYIKDYSGEGKDNSFSNGYYRTYFATIYNLDAKKEVKLFGLQN
jgi:hypothetical protein